MPRQVFLYDPPERFVAGTVGRPGQRAFYLQASAGTRTTSVLLEKQQVSALAERIGELLDEVTRRSQGRAPIPPVAPAELHDDRPLRDPVDAEFRVAAMAIAWDFEASVLMVEAEARVEDDEEDDAAAAEPPVLRVRISGAVARAFVRRSLSVVAAGRPPCPFCDLPLDPEGHICPRQNGYRRGLS